MKDEIVMRSCPHCGGMIESDRPHQRAEKDTDAGAALIIGLIVALFAFGLGANFWIALGTWLLTALIVQTHIGSKRGH